jgi:hypothetical protein
MMNQLKQLGTLCGLGWLSFTLGFPTQNTAMAQDCEPQWAAGVFCPEGLDGIVNDLVVRQTSDGELVYAGGNFLVDCQPSGVAVWDGQVWTALGGSFNGEVKTLAMSSDDPPVLYAGGIFTSVADVPASRIARWDGIQWQPVGNGFNNGVEALQFFNNGSGEVLYAGGFFSGYLAQWNGTAWNTVPNGPSGAVYALHVSSLDINTGRLTAELAVPQFVVRFGLGAQFTLPQNIDIGDVTGLSFEGTVSGISGQPSRNAGSLLLAVTPPVGQVYNLGSGILAPQASVPWDFTGPQSILNGTYRHGIGGEQWSGNGLPDPGLSAPVSTGNWTLFFREGDIFSTNATWTNVKITLHGTSQGSPSTKPWLYVGGGFFSAGGTEANNVARFDGSTWETISSGAKIGVTGNPNYGGTVTSLLVDDFGQGPELVIGGDYISYPGNPGPPPCPERYDPDTGTYLAGCPDDLNCQTAVCDILPYCCDGEWYSDCVNLSYQLCSSEIVSNGMIRYRAGQWIPFTTPDGLSILDEDAVVSDLHNHDTGNGPSLYASGYLSLDINPNDYYYSGVARIDGNTIESIGFETQARFGLGFPYSRALATAGSAEPRLLAGGLFTELIKDGSSNTRFGPFGGIASWDESTWESVGYSPASAIVGRVRAQQVFDDGSGQALYAGGNFTTAGGVTVNRIAKWDGNEWSSLTSPSGTGVNFDIYTLTVFDDGSGPALYAGGLFTTAGGVTVNRIAKWDGNEWSALTGPTGTGVSSSVNALTVFDDGSGPALYAAGLFTTAGGVTVNRIAKWNGNEWSALAGPTGIGVRSSVYALTVFDDGSGPALYAGGFFTTAGGVTVNRIAKWDGNEWSALAGPTGIGVSSSVYALTVIDDGSGPALYAGGFFTTAGGVTVNRIVKWDDAQWSALEGPNGIGVNNTVYSIEVFDDGSGPAIYAGGDFFTAGGTGSVGIAKWAGCSDTTPECPGDIADDFGTLGSDEQVSFGDFLALLGLIGPCPGGTPGCTGDIADDFGTLGGDGQVSFGDFLALLGLIGPCA